jgi:hypothetical protein
VGNYESLYTWAQERQQELRREAAVRRLIRQARRERNQPGSGWSPRRPLAPVIPLLAPPHHARAFQDDPRQDRSA